MSLDYILFYMKNGMFPIWENGTGVDFVTLAKIIVREKMFPVITLKPCVQ